MKKVKSQSTSALQQHARQPGPAAVFLTGLTLDAWKALWEFLEPSAKNFVSARAAKKEAEGRKISVGGGRKPDIGLEDQLLMTLIRLYLGRMEQELALYLWYKQLVHDAIHHHLGKFPAPRTWPHPDLA